MRLSSLLFLFIAVSVNCDGFQESQDPAESTAIGEIDAAIREGDISRAWDQFKKQALIAGSTDNSSSQVKLLEKGIEICILANNPLLANDLLRPARRIGLLKSDAQRARGLLIWAQIHFALGEYRDMNDALIAASDYINEETTDSDLALLFAQKALHAWLLQENEAAEQFIKAALKYAGDELTGHASGIVLMIRAFLSNQRNDPNGVETNLGSSYRAFENEIGSIAFHALLARMLKVHSVGSINSIDMTILQFASRADRFDVHWLQATGFSAKAEILRRNGEYSQAVRLLQESLDQTGLIYKELDRWKTEWERISPIYYRPPVNASQTYPVYLIMLILLLVVCMLLLLLRIRTQRLVNESLLEAIEKSKIAEMEAEHASRLKSQFVANVSHEIKTPMSGLVGMTSLLEEMVTDPTQRKYLATIRSCSRNLLVLMNDLLDLARIESNKLEIDNKPFRMDETINYCQEVVRLNAEEKGLELIVEIDGGVPETLIGDATRISQIMTNLLHNAIKFTEKGIVRLSVNFDQLNSNSGNLQVMVEDTGSGIRPDRIQTVFEPFNQNPPAKQKDGTGSGLGLAICKKLTDHMGGSLSVTSELGRGSVFMLSLPVKLTSI